jgi:3-phenylpropionate/trans-cinnamate dioxygenase ferredoxin subunit
MPRLRIASTDDVPAGTARFFPMDCGSVTIVNDGERFYAVDGLCPHKGFELDHAFVIHGCIECPWHGYQYDLRTGENVYPSRVYLGDLSRPADPIATYPMEVVDGEIWVELP